MKLSATESGDETWAPELRSHKRLIHNHQDPQTKQKHRNTLLQAQVRQAQIVIVRVKHVYSLGARLHYWVSCKNGM